MRCLATLMVLLLTGCASVRPAEKFAIGCSVADIGTTAYGLSLDGIEEGNPILAGGSDGATVALAIGLNVGVYYLLKQLNKTTPQNKQKWTWLAYGIVKCGVAAHNIKVIYDSKD